MRSSMLWGTEESLFRILHDAPPIWESRKVCVRVRMYVHEKERSFDISEHERQSVYDSAVSSSCLLTLAPPPARTAVKKKKIKNPFIVQSRVCRWNQSAVIFNEVMEATVNSQIDISPRTINKFLMCFGRVWEGQTQQEKCVPGKIVKDGFHAHTHKVVIPQHMLGCSAQTDICPLGNLFMLD